MDAYAHWRARLSRRSGTSPPRDAVAATFMTTTLPPPPFPSSVSCLSSPSNVMPAGENGAEPAAEASMTPQRLEEDSIKRGAQASLFNAMIFAEPQPAVSRLQEVLTDIAATERRQEKTWLNVQPCVLHTIKLLATAVQSQTMRIAQLEADLKRSEQCLEVLVQDREVKEQRYRIDSAAQREAMEEVWRHLLAIEAQQQQQCVPAPLQRTEPQVGLAEAFVSRTVFEARVRSLEKKIRRMQRCPHTVTPPLHREGRPHRHTSPADNSPRETPSMQTAGNYYDGVPRRRCASSCSVSSSPLSSRSPSELSSTTPQDWVRQGYSASGNAAAHEVSAGSPAMRRVKDEVQRLRRQWRRFLHTVPTALLRSMRAPTAVDGGRGSRKAHPPRLRRVDHLHVPRPFPLGNTPELGGNDAERETKFCHEAGLDSRTADRPFRRDGVGASRGSFEPQAAHPFERAHGSVSPECDEESRPLIAPLAASGRRLRWYWSGDAQSHFSTAIRRADGASSASGGVGSRSTGKIGVSPALPWTELHAYDGRTDCWYIIGSWAKHQQQLRAVMESERSGGEDQLDWISWTTNLVSWLRPASLLVERAGVYSIRVCLVRHCTSSSLASGAGRVDDGGVTGVAGVLTVWVNGVAILGTEEAVTHTLLYAPLSPPSTTSTSPWRSRSNHSRNTIRGRQPFYEARPVAATSRENSPIHRRCRGDVGRTSPRQCACCEPAQLHTNSLVAYIFLPAGAILQVRCRGMHDTKCVHEAFCELEYVL